MKRLDVYRRIPQEPRDIIRGFIHNREDALLLNETESGGRQKIIKVCEESIRGLLSLYFKGKELERAYKLLVEE